MRDKEARAGYRMMSIRKRLRVEFFFFSNSGGFSGLVDLKL